jgi:hypothetical protein
VSFEFQLPSVHVQTGGVYRDPWYPDSGLSLTFYCAGSVEDARSAKLNAVVTWLAEKYRVT